LSLINSNHFNGKKCPNQPEFVIGMQLSVVGFILTRFINRTLSRWSSKTWF